jgi:nucleoid-associated protein YgaU
MFSAMISRPLLLLLGSILAFGAGWAVYELRVEQTADAPSREASGPAPEETVGVGGGPQAPKPAAGQARLAGRAPGELVQTKQPTRQSAPSEPPSQSQEEEQAAPAVPTTAAEQAGSSPSPDTRTAADPATATSDVPGASAAPSPRGDSRVTDEPRPASARVAETIRRAVEALLGGASDEPAVGGEEAQVAGVPDTMPADPAPDRGRAAAGTEPAAAPSFDIVRVEPDGQAVIAGRAAPGAEVELRSGDRTIDRVRADQRGEWVALPPEPLGAGVQELTLAARVENQPAVASEEVVVVAVPESPPPQPARDVTAEPPSPQPAQDGAGDASDEAFAVALPREGAGKGRILQAPGRIGTDGALALVMLDYDEAGRIRLSGEADAGTALRIYVDNQPAGTTVVGPGGQWDAVLERTLTPGDYTLRLDQLDASGRPDARLETPFTRVSHPPIEGDAQVDYVIVQPGNSLWRIARRVLGEGMRYVHIYQANEGQIRDPDLIYPGQVFELPGGIRPAG